MAALVAEDDPVDCDRIRWNSLDRNGDGRADLEDRIEYYTACDLSTGVLYVVGCIELDPANSLFGPPTGSVYLVCNVLAGNYGSDDVFVSPFDFAAVDAGNSRYQLDFTALALTGADKSFPSSALPPDQTVTRFIAFAVPASADAPIRIEIDPLLSLSGSSEPLVIILDPLGRVSQ